ncbi:FMN-binding negative transcriptional regulator [Alloacidobacterium dinghuense]|uniref:FMN-binding negative transcriptional regulator n=1 Tax=Alloacidobacterium dinghuense TaxID=2763107 RepID=A0A7G8BES7_9BACT|nr:FMN-binding negative transcriptional regulator [Alloacidobacterium dinghuense]QNI31047.1 FMN-binding negative transcriptional regulator [Alloacidobacterium dinghuense]
MYIPRHHEETRVPVLHQLMQRQPFASLITFGISGLYATHLPMVLDEQEGSLGVLRGHISRANIQWREYSPDVESLAIFSGPHHYISPSWYAEKQETGKVVPTWNYAVVHAYGYLKVIEDAAWLRAHVERLTNIHEATSPEPWKVTDAPAGYVASLVKGIVGLELPIERLEGKWKVSQNRSEADRRGVIAGLEELDTTNSMMMRQMVSDTL